jgi:hypothetical protein
MRRDPGKRLTAASAFLHWRHSPRTAEKSGQAEGRCCPGKDENNGAFLALIAQTEPESVSGLAFRMGGAKPDRSKTSKTHGKDGLIHLETTPARQMPSRPVSPTMTFQECCAGAIRCSAGIGTTK